MTQDKTFQIFSCIHPAEPVCADTVMKGTGLSRLGACQKLHRLCGQGKLIKLSRGVYTLATFTEASPARIAQIKAEVERAKVALRKRMRQLSQASTAAKRREKARAEAERAAAKLNPTKRDAEVVGALAKQPALVTAWGGACNV